MVGGLRLVRLTSEALLAQMAKKPMFTSYLSAWAVVHRIRPWVSHDLTREVLTADLRWRNPDWYAELHRRARIYYTTRLQQTHVKSSIVYYSITFSIAITRDPTPFHMAREP